MDEIIALFEGDKSKVNIPVISQTDNPNGMTLTPLCWLISRNVSYYVIKQFIRDYNPDINVLSQFDISAIKFVCQTDNVKLMKLLLKNGANINQCNPNPIYGDRPPLHFACRGTYDSPTFTLKKHMNMIKTLIDYGADLNLLDKDGKKPLEYLTLTEKAQIGIFDNIFEIDDDDSDYELY